MSRKKSSAKSHRLSNVTKPSGMTLQHWQVTLREQAAEKETFGISEVGPVGAPGEYLVRNPVTRSSHLVHYHGMDHPFNSCSCMDFRTSRLGTCKHIEAVREWIGAKRSRMVRHPDPATTLLFMDYKAFPRPRVRYGSRDREKLRKVFEGITDLNGYITDSGAFKLANAIQDARQASGHFVCRGDVIEYSSRQLDDLARRERLEGIFKDEDWWKDIFCNGVVPYSYQKEGIEFAASAGRCIIADEMGLGKTLQAIGTAALLRREGFISSVLIVCPTSLKYQWKREIKNFVGEDALVIEGNHLARKKMYEGPQMFKIVSYNSLSNDMKILGGMDVDMVVMDEVQRLKNWDTQIAHGARKVKADYSVILSGTPLENKLEELYSIVQLVDQYILGPYYLFRQEHIETSPSGKVIGYKGLNSVGETLKPLLLRRRKADVALQLPERIDSNIFVPMTKEQMGIHQEYQEQVARIVLKWQRTHYLSETDRRRLLTFLSMMRMVCDSTFILDQVSRNDTKVDETMNILDNIFESGDDKVVIFSSWERMTRLIARELENRGIGFSNLHGGVPSVKRKELMDRFTDDPEVRVFLSTDAGSTGLNLQAASYIINLDLPWNPAVLEQRIGRIYRIGQRRNIQVINLVSVGTIEERMLSKLKFKTDLFDGVLNGGEDNIFLDDNKLESMVKDFALDAGPLEVNNSLAGTEVIDESEIESPSSGEARGLPSDEAEVPSEAIDSTSEASDVPSKAVDSPSDVIGKGAAFFGSLLDTLKDPEATGKLVDTLVKEDPSTGKASINIPISGKEPVRQLLDLIGKMLK